MDQLALIVPGMWADHHVITVRGLFHDTEDVQVIGASALDATLRLEYDPAKTDPQKIAAQLEQAGYPTGEAPDAEAPPTDKPAWLDVRSARHRHGPCRSHDVGRPPQVLIADRSVRILLSTNRPGARAARTSRPVPRTRVKESPHG